MKTTYWKRESLVDGRILALFKEENGKGYYYKNGEWHEDADVITKAKWEDDYEVISEAEANQIMKQL